MLIIIWTRLINSFLLMCSCDGGVCDLQFIWSFVRFSLYRNAIVYLALGLLMKLMLARSRCSCWVRIVLLAVCSCSLRVGVDSLCPRAHATHSHHRLVKWAGIQFIVDASFIMFVRPSHVLEARSHVSKSSTSARYRCWQAFAVVN